VKIYVTKSIPSMMEIEQFICQSVVPDCGRSVNSHFYER